MDPNDKILTELSHIQSFNDLFFKIFVPFASLLVLKSLFYVYQTYVDKYTKKSVQKRIDKQRLATMLEHHITSVASSVEITKPISVMDIKMSN
jgi:low temperature requirement protein LtrA